VPLFPPRDLDVGASAGQVAVVEEHRVAVGQVVVVEEHRVAAGQGRSGGP